MTESIRTKLIRIMNLAERGAAGEREAAAHLLHILMEKYGVTPEDLRSEETEYHRFEHVCDPLDHALFTQIAATVLNTQTLAYKQIKGKSLRWVKCTTAQAIEIRNQYEFYRKEFRLQLARQKRTFLSAFIQANDIYPEDGSEEIRDPYSFSDEEIARLLEIQAMAANIKRSHYHKQLESCRNSR